MPTRTPRGRGSLASGLASRPARSLAGGLASLLACLPVCLAVTLAPSRASAFTVQNAVAKGCHERITAAALRGLRRAGLATAAPIEPTDDDRVLIDDAPFHVPDDMGDLGGAALLFGVRDPDLEGRGGTEIDELALIHGDPSSQDAHCLRRESDDDPDGSVPAIAACRSRVLSTFEAALVGLDARGAPDPNDRVDFVVTLGVRGKVTVPLPRFHVEMGKSMHALQDSFTHMLRTKDGVKPTTVLNWVEWVDHKLDEGRDGPAHLAAMDQCDDSDPLLTQRRTLAEQASVELLQAALDPSLTKEQKMTRAAEVADRYLSYQPGCTQANDWCDAAEFDVKNHQGCLCRAPGAGSARGARGAGAPLASLAFLALAGVLRRLGRRARQGRPSLPRRARGRLAAAAATALVLLPWGSALAAEEAAPAAPPKAPEPKPVSGFSLYLSAAASIDKPAAAATVGGRYRLSSGWIVGLDAEWNPFYAKSTKQFRAGVFNGYGTLIRQYPLKYEPVSLRTTLNLGTSVLLMDLVGAPSGHPGLFVGVSPLGLEWRLTNGVYLVVDPTHIAVPVPQITGVPFGYVQYRFVVGLELG